MIRTSGQKEIKTYFRFDKGAGSAKAKNRKWRK